jgi:dephospho-CoA kinase
VLRIGLTGGIGSGKSTVARRLAERGAMVIDADRLAREVVEPGTDGLAEIRARFGDEVLGADGSLDRGKLAGRVFGDQEALAALNAIVHPKVGARTAELISAAAQDAIVVHDVPLLVENGLAPAYHAVLVVDAPVPERVRRLTESRGMAEADVLARIENQATDEQRRAAADVWLDNSGQQEQVRAQVDRLLAERLRPFEENVRLRRVPERGSPEIADYDPTWPAQAARIIARLRVACGAEALRVDHVGSTAVPGLAAKDVLDFQITVADLGVADKLADRLAGAGFPSMPAFTQDTPKPVDPDPEHWRKRTHASADPGRWANVHVRAAGSSGCRYALLFPAWLRANDAERQAYENVKRGLARDFAGRSIPQYADAKDAWVTPAHDRAAAWAARTGWEVG